MNTSVPLTPQRIGIILLTLATAIIHLILAFTSGGFFLVAFLLNAIGYLVLLGALYLTPDFLAGQRSLVHWALLAFTAVTFVLYFVFNWPDIWGTLGIVDKSIELLLIILLIADRP